LVLLDVGNGIALFLISPPFSDATSLYTTKPPIGPGDFTTPNLAGCASTLARLNYDQLSSPRRLGRAFWASQTQKQRYYLKVVAPFFSFHPCLFTMFRCFSLFLRPLTRTRELRLPSLLQMFLNLSLLDHFAPFLAVLNRMPPQAAPAHTKGGPTCTAL